VESFDAPIGQSSGASQFRGYGNRRVSRHIVVIVVFVGDADVDWTLLYWTQRWFTDSDFLGESWTRSTSVSFARFSISRALVLLVSLSDSEAACFIHGAAELVPVAQHP